jgi:hypothetical protein
MRNLYYAYNLIFKWYEMSEFPYILYMNIQKNNWHGTYYEAWQLAAFSSIISFEHAIISF